MARYKLQASDGKTYSFDAADGLTEEQARAVLDRSLGRMDRKPKKEKDAVLEAERRAEEDRLLKYAQEYDEYTPVIDDIEEFFKGIPRGVGQLVSGIAEGGSSMLGLEDDTIETMRGAGDWLTEAFAADAGTEDLYSGKIGDAMGQIAGLVGAGALTKNPMIVGAGLGALSGAGEASQRARQAGASKEDRMAASYAGLAPGALEAAPWARMFPFLKGLEDLPPNINPLTRIRRAFEAGGMEAAQETASNVAQNLIEQGIYNPERQTLDGSFDAATVGGGAGALFQALVDTALGRRARARDAADLEELTAGEMEQQAVDLDSALELQDLLAGERTQQTADIASLEEFLAEEDVRRREQIKREEASAARQARIAELRPRVEERQAKKEKQAAREARQARIAELRPKIDERAALADERELENLIDNEYQLQRRDMQPIDRQVREREIGQRVAEKQAMLDEANAEAEQARAAVKDQAAKDRAEIAGIESKNQRQLSSDFLGFDDKGKPKLSKRKGQIDMFGQPMTENLPTSDRDLMEVLSGTSEYVPLDQRATQRAPVDGPEMPDLLTRPEQFSPLLPTIRQTTPPIDELAPQRAAEAERMAQSDDQLMALLNARGEEAQLTGDKVERARELTNKRSLNAFRALSEERKAKRERERAEQETRRQAGQLARPSLPAPDATNLEQQAQKQATGITSPINALEQRMGVQQDLGGMNQQTLRDRQTVDRGVDMVGRNFNAQRAQQDMFPYEAATTKGSPQPKPETPTQPRVIDEKMLDDYGFARSMPIRKRIVGKDLNNPTDNEYVRGQLEQFVKTSGATEKAKAGASRMLDDLSPDQTNLAFPSGRPARPKKPKAAPEQEAKDAEEVDSRRTGTGVVGSEPSTVGRGRGSVDTRTTEPTPPTGRGLGKGKRVPDRPRGRTAKSNATLKQEAKSADKPQQPTKASTTYKPTVKLKEPKQAPKKLNFKELVTAKERVLASLRNVVNQSIIKQGELIELGIMNREAVDRIAAREAVENRKTIQGQRWAPIVLDTGLPKPRFDIMVEAERRLAAERAREARRKHNAFHDAQERVQEESRTKKPANVKRDRHLIAHEKLDNIPNEDKLLIQNLVQFGNSRMSGKRWKPETAAREVFAEKERFIDNLVMLGWNLANSPKEATKYKAAKKWVDANLSKRSQDLVTKWQEHFSTEHSLSKLSEMSGDSYVKAGRKMDSALDAEALQQAKDEAADKVAARSLAKQKDQDWEQDVEADLAKMERLLGLPMLQSMYEVDSTAAVNQPLHPDIMEALTDGDLENALKILGDTNSHPAVRELAKKLATMVGTTQVRVVDDMMTVYPKENPRTIGYYDPQINTITLTPEGYTPHTLLHEMVHAVVMHTIAKGDRIPAVRNLNKIYEATKAEVAKTITDGRKLEDVYYGFTNLQEFASEVLTNPEFQKLLTYFNSKGKDLRTDKTLVRKIANYYNKVMDALVDLVSKVFGWHSAPPTGTAAGEAVNLLHSIMHVAPESAALNGLAHRTPDEVAANINRNVAIHGRRKYTSDMSTKLKSRWEKTMGAARAIPRWLLSTNNLADLVGNKIPEARALDTLIHRHTAAIHNANTLNDNTISKIIKPWQDKYGREYGTLFSTVALQSTLSEVDPNLTRAEAEAKYRETIGKDANGKPITRPDPEKMQDWANLQEGWRMLKSVGGDKVFQAMRNTYQHWYAHIRKHLGARLDEATNDPVMSKQLKAIVEKAAIIDPYFPLTRSGDYWLKFTSKDGREVYQEAFESAAERESAMRELADKYKNEVDVKSFEPYTKEDVPDFSKAPPDTFMFQLAKVLDMNKASPETKQAVTKLFLSSLPDHAFVKSFSRRERRSGFETDVFKSFEKKAFSMARQAVSTEYMPRYAKIERDLRERKKTLGSKDQDYAQMVIDNIQFAKNPQVAGWSRKITSGLFGMTLGANISAAFINTSQLPMVVLPMLAARHGIVNTSNAMANATKLFTMSGTSRMVDVMTENGIVRMPSRGFPGIDAVDYEKMKRSPDPKMRQYAADMEFLVKELGDLGQLSRSITSDTLDLDGSFGREKKINKIVGMFFHHAERFNRQVTLAAAFDLRMKDMRAKGINPTPDMMKQTVLDVVNESDIMHGSAHAASAPKITQGNVGRIIMMYKRYGLAMYFAMFNILRNGAGMGMNGKADQKLAFKQGAGLLIGSATVAGLHGIAGYGIIKMIYDLFAEDDEDDFDTMVRKVVPELAFNGAGNAIFGWDMASRMGLSDLLFRDPFMADEKSAIQLIAEVLGGPAIGMVNNAERAVDKFNEGDYDKAFEAMAPAAIRNVAKTWRYSQEGGALNSRGVAITDEFDAMELTGQLIGFSPARYARQSAANNNEMRKDKAANNTSAKLKRKAFLAMEAGDYYTYQEAIRELMEFNRRHPNLAVDAEALQSSFKASARTSREMINGISISSRRRQEAIQSLAELDENITIWDMLD